MDFAAYFAATRQPMPTPTMPLDSTVRQASVEFAAGKNESWARPVNKPLENIRPNNHRAPGNRYYITILRTPEQQFSAATLRYCHLLGHRPGALCRNPHKNPTKIIEAGRFSVITSEPLCPT